MTSNLHESEGSTTRYCDVLEQVSILSGRSRQWALLVATSLCTPHVLADSRTALDDTGTLVVAGGTIRRRIPLSQAALTVWLGAPGRSSATDLVDLALDLGDLFGSTFNTAIELRAQAIRCILNDSTAASRPSVLSYAGLVESALPESHTLVAASIGDRKTSCSQSRRTEPGGSGPRRRSPL